MKPTFVRSGRLVPAYVVAATLMLGLALVAPGRTFGTVYGHDLFVHLDGAWRIVSGQIPSRDFHTPLGLIAYLLPGVALAVTGSLGLAMPAAMLFYAVILMAPMIWICESRLPRWLALLFATYLLVLVMAPINIGESPKSLSFAMYYNRWSWATVSLIFVALVPRRNEWRLGDHTDAAVIGVLLTLLFHLKATFFCVGLGYVAAMIVVPRTRRAAGSGIAVMLVLLGLTALALGSTSAYVADIRHAAAVSGVVRSGLYALFTMAVMSGRTIVILAMIALMTWTRRIAWTEALAGSYITVSSIILANQNSQGFELPALVAAGLVLLLAPPPPGAAADSRWSTVVPTMALLALTYNPLVLGLAALVLHASGAAHARPARAMDGIALGSIVANPWAASPAQLTQIYRGGASRGDLALLRTDISAAEYGRTVEEGVALLSSNPALAGTVETLDLANPFNVLLRRPPPRGDNSWNHFGRTFSDTVHLDPRAALNDVSVIMEPKDSMGADGTAALLRIDRQYMQEHFRLIAESSFWRAYARTGTGRA